VRSGEREKMYKDRERREEKDKKKRQNEIRDRNKGRKIREKQR